MNWRPSDELEELLNGLADEMLSEPGEARLAEILRGDAAARAHYRKWMAMHSALTWDYAASAPEVTATESGMARTRWWRNAYALAAALAVLAAIGAFFFPRTAASSRDIVSLENVSGAVSWSDGAGVPNSALKNGAALTEGTLTVEGEGASAQMRFADGTLITFPGDSEVAFSDDGQKRLVLRRGTFTAQVTPQPRGKPMLVRTATAEMEVLGTVFAVSAEAGDTSLNVESGRVKLRRLVDGKDIEVASQQSVVASLDAKSVMNPSGPATCPATWHRTFDTPPPSSSKGEWFAPGEGVPGRVLAVPYVAGRAGDGTPHIFHGISARAPQNEPRAYVSVSAESVVRLRFRMKEPSTVKVFVSCQREGGTFGGNFEGAVPSPAPDAEGWRVAELPLASFKPLIGDRYTVSAGTRVFLTLVHSIDRDAGLEVAEISIAPHQP
ncbi:MAG: FecR family protein [Chthoniobacteraceae bacterium]